MVANLPYSIATPLLLRTIAELPGVEAWTLMVQREIADRLRAAPGSRTYGAPSVLLQLACDVRMLRTVDRAVFTPRPRVDSALIGVERTGPAASADVVALVRDGFAHRRKSLARSLDYARPGIREAAREALVELGLAPDARAEQLAPAQFVALAAALEAGGRPMKTLRAPAKLNLCLYLGGRRDDGLHELRSLFCPLLLSDRITVSEAEGEADEVVCPGVRGPNLVGVALEGMRARGWSRPPLRVEIDKRIPVAAGLGGGSADAAAILRLAAGELRGLAELAAGLGADVPSQLDPAMALVGGAGEVVEPLPTPGEFAAVLIGDDEGLATGDVYAEADSLGLGRSAEELERIEARLREVAGGGASPLDYAELLVNDLEQAAVSLRPRIAEALAALDEVGAVVALVAGSGPTAVGLFEDLVAADAASSALPPRYANAIVSAPQRLG